MPNDTDQPTLAVLKPCPFCGSAMEDRGYGVMHTDRATCILAGNAFERAAWNTRTTHEPRPAGDLREAFLSQLRRVNTDRYQAWVGDGEDAGILFDAAELGGEVGELLNVVKKLVREERGWRGSRAAPEDFADECADVLICLDKLARRRSVDLEAATIAKFNATSDKVGLPHKLSPDPTSLEGGEGKYLVWSNEHKAWWGVNHCGYTRFIERAGRYDRAEALKIAGTRDGGWRMNKGNPDEIAIPEQDAVEQYADITAAQVAAHPSTQEV